MPTLRKAIHQRLDEAEKLSNGVTTPEFDYAQKPRKGRVVTVVLNDPQNADKREVTTLPLDDAPRPRKRAGHANRGTISELKPSHAPEIRILSLRPPGELRRLQNLFLDSKAFGRVLRWRDVSDKAIIEAIDLLKFLIWVKNGWDNFKRHPSPSPQPTHGHTAALHLLAEAREYMDPKFHAEADRLIKNLSKHRAKPLHSYLYDPQFQAKRGAAGNPISAFRGGLVRELNRRLPEDVEMRDATIAELLALAGDPKVSRQVVRVILAAGKAK